MVAYAALFLTSDEAKFDYLAPSFLVDGGMSVRRG